MIGLQFTLILLAIGILVFIVVVRRLISQVRTDWERVNQEADAEEQEQRAWHSRTREAEEEVARIYRAVD